MQGEGLSKINGKKKIIEKLTELGSVDIPWVENPGEIDMKAKKIAVPSVNEAMKEMLEEYKVMAILQLPSKLSAERIDALCATAKKVKGGGAVSCGSAKLKDGKEGKVQGDDGNNVLVPGCVVSGFIVMLWWFCYCLLRAF